MPARADDAAVAGVNDRVQLAELARELNRRAGGALQRAGVTVVDPADDLGRRRRAPRRATPCSSPAPSCTGRPPSARGAEIGPDTTLTDVELGDRRPVVRTHGSESTIGAGATVGPFAYLRPGTDLGERGKLGTFVETKNAEIGAGTKVPHLTYVGDADDRRAQQHRCVQRVRQLRRRCTSTAP